MSVRVSVGLAGVSRVTATREASAVTVPVCFAHGHRGSDRAVRRKAAECHDDGRLVAKRGSAAMAIVLRGGVARSAIRDLTAPAAARALCAGERPQRS
jgi:hypothetical protein